MAHGSFTFVLHSHMPYVLGHGTSPHGSDWLCEAAQESYLPLLDVCYRLVVDGISPRITLGLTPVLMDQLADPRFRVAFHEFVAERSATAGRDAEAFESQGDRAMATLARWWQARHDESLAAFRERWHQDIVGAFAALQAAGHIEIIASSATHGYSPLLSNDATIAAQVQVGIAAYRRHLGCAPRGYWLPECGYRPRSDAGDRRGVEEFLADNRIDYFITEAGISNDQCQSSSERVSSAGTALLPACAESSGEGLTPYSPHLVNSSRGPLRPVWAFSRDPATGVQVWSANVGYPGDPWYLDFHKRNSAPGAIPLGLRYWRVSGSDVKQPYEPQRAASRVRAHAEHFACTVATTLERQSAIEHPILCATYDTELFGHWWFEGGEFLYAAIKAIAARDTVERVTCSGYLDARGAHWTPIAPLPEGSWGAGGGHGVWLNPSTEWIWQQIHAAEATMARLMRDRGGDRRTARLMAQAAREILLLTSSDWPFLITTGGAVDYAEVRFNDHMRQFEILAWLIDQVGSGAELTVSHWKALADCEQRDRIFANIELGGLR